jgi:hypothetical protein
VSNEEYRIRRRGSLVLANNTVYDRNISYTALGVLAVLLARPDDAPKGYRTLLRPGVGQASILSAFRELRANGYRYQFYRTETTPKGNRVDTCTYIYEVPVSLEMAKRDHFEVTGQSAIEVTDRRKSKDTLASVPDAQDPDAQDPDAQAPDAQRPSFASVGFSPTNAEINQREATEGQPSSALDEKGTSVVGPSQPTAAPANAATPKPYTGITEEQMRLNREGAARARAALKGIAS